MKQLSADLEAHLKSGATTLCWCWRLTRRDGVQSGYTDHDRPLVFDATTFEASAGFTASDIHDGVGLSVDNLDVSGALSSTSLSEVDLAAGRYDDARIEIFRVNWSDPEQRVLMRTGSLGEVRRSGASFTAEVRGLAHYLQQDKGRLFQFTCDADLGDARCGVNVSQPGYGGDGTVAESLSARELTVNGFAAFDADWFTRGVMQINEGDYAGLTREIKRHSRQASEVKIALWAPLPQALAVGTGITLVVGCDKRLETCAKRFKNTVNFRGFPVMPGNAALTRIARQ